MTEYKQVEMNLEPTIEDQNIARAEEGAASLDWAQRMGLEVNDAWEIRNPETNDRVMLVLRKTAGGVTILNKEPLVYDYPTENVPDQGFQWSDAGIW